jgi:hypothetical protein
MGCNGSGGAIPSRISRILTAPRRREVSAVSEDDPRDEDDDEVEGDELEASIMQADHPFGAESPGTTAAEAAEGEGLDEALAQERPDTEATDEVLSLVDDGVSDVEGELAGDAVVERDEFASPEEAALSIRENVPGATDHDDPHGDQDRPDED